ncbi:VanW family protein [Micromonospora humi]|uniref:VanW like protein n=1 Tax=Micromonospora humi TaxID=745366 RepID=A0A1C5JNH0_9ACTN|nr:VanW family protein [Micromonospora humi]SCG72135.1 VanW like protein [Micromonospora humi]
MDLAAAVDRLIAAVVDPIPAPVRLPVVVLPPGNATPAIAGVDQLIGSFTTYHPCCQGRVTNIHRIADLVDGTIITPGWTFSLNTTAGERTLDRGFVPAPAIVNGELVDQPGGGVSQFSTTLFDAAWFAGLPILAHQPHTKYISRCPPGREPGLSLSIEIDSVPVQARLRGVISC